ncbi:MAG: hypothetical protein KDJ88_09305, partial [Bauldia sp.]|nr:hypothetical protein [Bauldia sp.]
MADYSADSNALPGSITGTSGIDTFTVTVVSSAAFDLSSITFTDWTAGQDVIIVDGAGFATSIDVTGSSQDETIYGGDAADTIDGGAGDDIIDGGAGADIIDGGLGNDTITYDSLDTTIAGGGDTDTLVVNGTATIDLSASDQSGGLDNA